MIIKKKRKSTYVKSQKPDRAGERALARTDVALIRWAVKQRVSKKWMARHFGVSSGTIDHICAYSTYKDIPPLLNAHLGMFKVPVHTIGLTVPVKVVEASLGRGSTTSLVATSFKLPIEYVEAVKENMMLRASGAVGRDRLLNEQESLLFTSISTLRAEVEISERSSTVGILAQRLESLRYVSTLLNLLAGTAKAISATRGVALMEPNVQVAIHVFAATSEQCGLSLAIDDFTLLFRELLAASHDQRLWDLGSSEGSPIEAGQAPSTPPPSPCPCPAGIGTGMAVLGSPTNEPVICKRCGGSGEQKGQAE